ncbi:type IV secretory system conjugative DNA transfer family protein [Gloeothece verrucosa]|uniref:TRAG family protein n=1 Tax=Gloeothece verrucosa (strain PCC 7822) TaxID=497965 RepID=E0ULT5_GLOV7|nr:type IV secretion system DNA-binding domain-containing protein [Gloeothece verrucosa]ADN17915.1 TRAG family protein [Gloeothece verrucosa PCC 7822]
MSSQVESVPHNPSIVSIDFGRLLGKYATPEGALMLGLLVVSLLLTKLGGSSAKLTSGRFCGRKELCRATATALKQIEEKKCQPVTLWAGTPKYWLGGKLKGLSAFIQTLLGSSPTVWFPHAERGILVIGAPGSGKTASVIDRAIESAMRQGHSILVYDKKGDQVRLHAALATRYGYSVEVFAPGYSYSGVINPLDFVTGPEDTTMAGEIGKIFTSSSRTGESKGNEFFETAGEMLARGLVQLAKASNYRDLAQVYAFIQLPNFVERIYHSIYRPDKHPLKMNPWIAPSFSQLMSSKDAEKTVAGIKATAEMVYSAFIQRDLLRAFIGKSTIPIKLKEKQILFFQLDDERRTVLAPLIAAALHLCIVSNLSQKRTNPFCYFLDEFPSIGRLPRTVNYVNEYRSNGGVPVLGIQSLEQLYDTYGERQGKAIASALSTHVLFYPGDYNTAEQYSKRYGETEVVIRSRSTGNSYGGSQTSRSTNWSEQIHKKPLLSPDEILRFPQGECVITSPAYGSGKEALFPYKLKIPIEQREFKRASESEALWDSVIRPQLEQRAFNWAKLQELDEENLHLEITKRIEEAFRMLPMPGELADGVVDKNNSDYKEQMKKIVAQTLKKLPIDLSRLAA